MIKKARYIKTVLGVKVNCSSKRRVLSDLKRRLKNKQKTMVVTVNPEMVMLAQKDKLFMGILNQVGMSVADGTGVVWALRRARKAHDKRAQGKSEMGCERIGGTNLMLELVKIAKKNNYKVMLAGGKSGVAQKAALKLQKTAGTVLTIKGITEPSVKAVNQFKPDMLFVALGHGRQEKWLAKNWSKLDIRLGMGVGGALDQVVRPWLRAPKCLQTYGLEWLWRLMCQPWRIKRQLSLLRFGYLILKKT